MFLLTFVAVYQLADARYDYVIHQSCFF